MVTHKYADLFFEGFTKSSNFVRNYKNEWYELEDGVCKTIGKFYYDEGKTCDVQVWYDSVTGINRWWFGLSFSDSNYLEEFKLISKLNIELLFDDDSFKDSWLMRIVEERCADNKEFFIGVYSKNKKETDAIIKALEIIANIPDDNYPEMHRKLMSGRGKEAKQDLSLKQYIYDNPHVIDVSLNTSLNGSRYKEYLFENTGDRANILFFDDNMVYSVIEVSTGDPLNSCHAVVRNAVLKRLELKLKSITDKKIKSYLITSKSKSNMTEEARLFCKKYGVIHYELDPK